MTGLLERTLRQIAPLNETARQQALERHSQLTKPPGSLGRLEELGARLSAITGRIPPTVGRRAVIVFAADHGVAADGVSAYPQAVTAQMVANFLRGGAAINVLARQAQARVLVVDMGVVGPVPDRPELWRRRIGPGTRSFAREPAMSREQARASVEAGIEVASRVVSDGVGLLACGEMGIGNSTAAAALTAVFTGRPAREVAGRGTGIDDETLERKVRLLEQALELHMPGREDPLGALAAVGGFEIGAIAGAILAAAAGRVPFVLDGFIATAGALVAQALSPVSASFLIAAHRSVEPGHRAALDQLGAAPLFDLGLRLGEGTGAALAFPLVEAAARVLAEMATFAEAGVSDKESHAASSVHGRDVPDGPAAGDAS
jgi:nicotinate-nucleotide--dimethylbenzimidazole phosphoribosyltransferase